MNGELRHLRYFVAVAEELHFTKAARRLHMARRAQPLSAGIRRFERELGVDLFDRNTRRVALSDAGRALLQPARDAIAAADAAFASAVDAATGRAGVLTVGISPAARFAASSLFEELRSRFPAIQLRTRFEGSRLIAEELLEGHLDVGIAFCASVPSGLVAWRITEARAVVVVSCKHRLARRRSVRLRELRKETIALGDPVDTARYNEAVLSACRSAGFEPRVLKTVGEYGAWERRVADGHAVGITGTSSAYTVGNGLKVLTLTPVLTFPIDLLCAASNQDRPLVAALRTVTGKRDV